VVHDCAFVGIEVALFSAEEEGPDRGIEENHLGLRERSFL
jgi:hypothetical protein